MKFGVREICDVVLKAKANQKVGDKIFYKNEPVLYFDTLKTSTLEGNVTTVYATGGRGNSRLVSWDGERTVTFTMEDALISPEGISILTGAGLIGSSEEKPIVVHQTERTVVGESGLALANKPFVITGEDYIYVMKLDSNGEVVSEPYIYTYADAAADDDGLYAVVIKDDEYTADEAKPVAGDVVMVDYYSAKYGSGVKQINITPDKFGGAYYLEASTLFRDQATGQDMPAEFIIPNCRVQSNFSFSMASSGDPSTFTFTMDAFPDYTRFDKTEKVIAQIQIISDGGDDALKRIETKSNDVELDGIIVDPDTRMPQRATDDDANG